MKLCAVAAIAIAVFLLSSVEAAKLVPVVRDYDALFGKFKAKYGKTYATPLAEGKARRAYEDNMRWAAELSAQNPMATFGDTVYMDVPREEFKKTHHNADFSAMLKKRKPIAYEASAGSKIDWRAKGAVTGVKNQLNCGGCWSFSTTGNIEGQWFLAGNALVSLSEQELLSCDTTTGNSGCNGGLMDYAFEWLINTQNGTIDTEASYPFVSGDGIVPACSLPATFGAQIYSYNDLPQSETKMAAYCFNNGPVSIGVDGSSFQTYTGGILTNCQFTQLDHAVLIVGFDDTYSTPYWIIKNSWGASWGESGYIRVEKGTNQCGLNQAATSSLVHKSGPTTPPTNSPPTPPPTNAPPTPPTPPPTSSPTLPPAPPSSGNFTFYLCEDSLCLGCQEYSLPQDTCIQESFNGDSFAAQCSASGTHLEVENWVGSETCSGSGEKQRVSAGVCYQNVDGQTYVAFSCGSSSSSSSW